MEARSTDPIQPGWKAYARDGSEAGTVIEADADGLSIRTTVDASEPVKVPTSLVVEAHAGRVELDLGMEAFGGSSPPEDSGPRRDPGSPPEVITPEQMRRLEGG